MIRPVNTSAAPNTPICVRPQRIRLKIGKAAERKPGLRIKPCIDQINRASQTRASAFFWKSPTIRIIGALRQAMVAGNSAAWSEGPAARAHRQPSRPMGIATNGGSSVSSSLTASTIA